MLCQTNNILLLIIEPQWNGILITDVDILIGLNEVHDPNPDAEIIYHRAPMN